MGSAMPLALEKSKTSFISHASPAGCQPACLVSGGAVCPTSVHLMHGCVIKSDKAGSKTLQPDKLVQESWPNLALTGYVGSPDCLKLTPLLFHEPQASLALALPQPGSPNSMSWLEARSELWCRYNSVAAYL